MRVFAAIMLAATAGLAGPTLTDNSHRPAGGWEARQSPGFYRMRLGDCRITVLSDGTASRDFPSIMSDPVEVRAAFARVHQSLPTDLSINAYLIDTGSRRILIDTGAGELFGISSGHLIGNLRAAGYNPQDIDAILLTHIHGDHSGGLSLGGRPVFRNAVVYVNSRDAAYWLNGVQEAKTPRQARGPFRQAHQTIDPYRREGRLRTFSGATQLFPEIRSVPESGHTPGMSGYMIESAGQRLFVWGDIVHATDIQFSDPSVTITYDVDPPAAIASRRAALRDADARGYLIGGAHLPFPGLGHVAREGRHFAWAPLPYEANL